MAHEKMGNTREELEQLAASLRSRIGEKEREYQMLAAELEKVMQRLGKEFK